jgi:hypothetical protein
MPLGRPRDLVAAIFDDAGLMASVVGEATDHPRDVRAALLRGGRGRRSAWHSRWSRRLTAGGLARVTDDAGRPVEAASCVAPGGAVR